MIAWLPARRTPLYRLAALVALQLSFSAAYITYFSYSFNYGERLIALHVCVVATLAGCGVVGLAVVAGRGRSFAARLLISIVPALAFALLTLLYATNYVSTGAWGHNVTFDLAARYLTRPAVLASYAATVTSWPVMLVVGAFIAGVSLCLASSRVVQDGLQHVFRLGVRADISHRTRFTALAMPVLLPGLAGVALAYTIPAYPRYELLLREPVIGFFIDSASVHRFSLSTFAVRFRSEGPRVRARYPPDQTFARRNVVVIVADSVRADHLQLYGYERPTSPFLNRLSASGKLRQVRLAMATCPDSNCGISSTLSSKSFGSMVPENFALHELLFDQGYDVNLILSGDHRWLGLRKFYGDDLTLYFDGTSSRRYAPTDDRLLFEGLEQVRRFGGKPAFFYFHLMSSHVLGYRQDRFAQFRPAMNLGALKDYAGVDLQTHINSYDNGLLQADAIIEQLFAALEEKGYLENALVVILSDHGEGLGEHQGARGHAFNGSLYQEFLHIPLLFYEESDARYANLEFATQVDVAPTIVSRLGLQVPTSWEGRSLLEPGVREFTYHYMDTYDVPLYALMHSTGGALYKYLQQSGREELYELTTDPHERHDLMSSGEAIAARLRERLTGTLASLDP
jgi:glucan phosphoethanolaminetransferase (alkaline phosphatase superfamily)